MGRVREGGRSSPRAMFGERTEGGERTELLELEFRKWACLSLNLQATAKPLCFVNYLLAGTLSQQLKTDQDVSVHTDLSASGLGDGSSLSSEVTVRKPVLAGAGLRVGSEVVVSILSSCSPLS